jgi:hypothetical protein
VRRLPKEIRDCRGRGNYRTHGAVYLLRCRRTGIYKVGAAHNPYRRLRQLISDLRRYGYDLEYVWSIASNGIGRLEAHWVKRWKGYRTDRRREWVWLPVEEVRRFMAVAKVIYKDCALVPEWIECVSGRLPEKRRTASTVPLADEVTVPPINL